MRFHKLVVITVTCALIISEVDNFLINFSVYCVFLQTDGAGSR